MEVSAKKAKIWRKDIQGAKGTWHKYSVSISTKTIGGERKTIYMPIRFAQKSGAPEEIPNGAVCDFEGFMSVDYFDSKNGEEVKRPQIVVMKAEFEDPTEGVDSFEQAEIEIPF